MSKPKVFTLKCGKEQVKLIFDDKIYLYTVDGVFMACEKQVYSIISYIIFIHTTTSSNDIHLWCWHKSNENHFALCGLSYRIEHYLVGKKKEKILQELILDLPDGYY